MRFKKLAALGATAVMLMSMSLTSVSAANTTDTHWTFSISAWQTSYTTPSREKTNSSAVYVYYEGGTPKYLTCDVLNSESQSMCHGRIGTIYNGSKGRIAQYVYEEGWHECSLKVTAPMANEGGAGGWWSPDCAGSCPYIN